MPLFSISLKNILINKFQCCTEQVKLMLETVCENLNGETTDMDSISVDTYSTFEIKGEEKLKKNSTLNEESEIMRSNVIDTIANQTNEPIKCGSCVQSNNAIAHCNDCLSFLCGLCEFAHKNMKCFKGHYIQELDHVTVSKTTAGVIHCSIHQGLPVRYYCWKCRLFICSICATNAHANDQFTPIPEAEESLKQSIHELTEKAVDQLKRAKENLTFLQKHSSTLKKNAEMAKQKIMSAFSTFELAIQKNRDKNIVKLNDLLTQLLNWQLQMERQISKLKEIEHLGRDNTQNINLLDLILLENKMASELTKEVGEQLPDTYDFSVKFETNLNAIPLLIDDVFGELKVSDSMEIIPMIEHLPSCCVFSQKNVRANEKSSTTPPSNESSLTENMEYLTLDDSSPGSLDYPTALYNLKESQDGDIIESFHDKH